MAHVLLLSLFILQTNWPGSEVRHCMCACTHVHLCIEPALHSTRDKLPGRDHRMEPLCFIWKDFACQLYTESLLSAVNTTAVWQQSERGWQLLNLPAPCPLTCSEQQLSVADIHFPGSKNPFHSLPIPPPFWSRTWSSYTLLTNSVSLCWHSDKTTVSITLWPFSLSFNSTTLMNKIVH